MKIQRFLAFFIFAAVIIAVFSASASAKDEWLHVRSKNFNLIGNASEKEIRKVATKLEQFREAFRILFSKTKLSASIPTNVIVFKSGSAYKPFKPRRADGKADTWIAGYFQSGEDVNYITLSTEGEDADTFGTIFHEYVHFIINTNFGKSDVPPWFNEGLAEYYQTFEMDGEIKAKLGLPQFNHISLLKQNKLIPLDMFFNITNTQLHQNGSHSRSIFYAQAWATIHYLIANQKTEGLTKFLALSLNGAPEEKAFQDAFNMTYQQMEKEIRKYVERSTYQYIVYTFKNKISPDNEMQTSLLNESDANAYLGDLLYHTHRYDDAEPYLNTALALEPDSSLANTTMGMVRLRQRKFDESRAFLEKAIAGDPRNHIAYYQYAYLLSRDGRDEFGFVSGFSPETAAKIREMLKKAIEIDPSYTDSYELLAFVSLVVNEGLDEAVAVLRKALSYQPGNQRYALRIAEIFLRQDKLDEASALANKIAKTSDEPEIEGRADKIIENIRTQKEFAARNEEARKQYEAAMAVGAKNGGTRQFVLRRKPTAKALTDEERAKLEKEIEIQQLNREITEPTSEEKQVLGNILKIECKEGSVVYTIRAESETLFLSSIDFQGLKLAAYLVDLAEKEIGCNANVAAFYAVMTYKPQNKPKSQIRGELSAIEFVPAHFRFVNVNEAPADDAQTNESVEAASDELPPANSGEDFAAEKRNLMMQAIKENLRKPLPDEKREIGFIEKSECNSNGLVFFIKTETQTLKMSYPAGAKILFRSFSPDVEGLRLGCGMKSVDVPVVVVYKEITDKKSRTDGEIVSVEFVPKGFVLEN